MVKMEEAQSRVMRRYLAMLSVLSGVLAGPFTRLVTSGKKCIAKAAFTVYPHQHPALRTDKK